MEQQELVNALPCPNLEHDALAPYHGGEREECPSGLIGALIRQAKRDEEIIQKMKAAICDGDKDAVFELARELVGHE